HDLSRGYFSEFRQTLEGFGPVASRLGDRLEAMERQGKDATEAYSEFLTTVAKQSDTTVRQLARDLGVPFAELRRLSDQAAAGRPRPPRHLPPDEQRELEQNLRRNKQFVEDVTHSVEDLGTAFTTKFLQVAVPGVNRMMIEMKALGQVIGDVLEKFNLLPKGKEGAAAGEPTIPYPGYGGLLTEGPTRQGPFGPYPGRLHEQYFEQGKEELKDRFLREQQERAGRRRGTGDPLLDLMLPRQAGGPASSGRPYLVGERGPELFVPQASG